MEKVSICLWVLVLLNVLSPQVASADLPGRVHRRTSSNSPVKDKEVSLNWQNSFGKRSSPPMPDSAKKVSFKTVRRTAIGIVSDCVWAAAFRFTQR